MNIQNKTKNSTKLFAKNNTKYNWQHIFVLFLLIFRLSTLETYYVDLVLIS